MESSVKSANQLRDENNIWNAEFLIWNNPPSVFETFHYRFQEYQDENLKVGQPTEQSLVRLHRCVSWSGSIQVAKTNHFQFQQDKGEVMHYSVPILNQDDFIEQSPESKC